MPQLLPLDSTDFDIRDVVAVWWEHVASDEFGTAIKMVQPAPGRGEWTPELLAATIRGYGNSDLDLDTLSMMHDEWGVSEFKAASIVDHAEREAILADIKVDRDALYGLNPESYVGMVHFQDVPLHGGRSDMTARFHIARAGADCICLEFLDVHAM